MTGFRASYILLVLAVLCRSSTQTEKVIGDKDICRLFKDGTLLRKPGDCAAWIRCNDGKSSDAGLCAPGKYYSLSKKTCGNLEKSDTYCAASSPCTAKTSGYVPDKKSCEGWFYCDGKKSLSNGKCDNGLFFSLERQMCVYPGQVTCEATFEFCDVTPPNVPFMDENNCHMYFTCTTAKKLQSNQCKEGTYYDVKLGECIRKSQVNCFKHPYPENVCGTTKLAKRNKFVADGATCRGYYYCRDLGSGKPDPSPSWAQCGVGYFFDEVFQRCVEREQAKCREDRCDGIVKGREISEIRGCRHYLECENGVEMGVHECEPNTFFDAIERQCVYQYRAYGACS